MIDVTLVTCRAHPRLPEDDQILLASLERRGMRHRVGSGPTRQTPDNLHTPTAEELNYCRELLGSLPRLTYARVDLLPFYGRPALMELEIIDPSLFFKAQPSAADALAAEVQAALEHSGPTL